MGAVQGTVAAEVWLSAVRDLTERRRVRAREQMVLVRVHPAQGVLTMLDEGADSSYAITLPVQVAEAAAVRTCRVPMRKLELILQVFGQQSAGAGPMTLVFRRTTFACRQGKRQALLPSYVAEEPVAALVRVESLRSARPLLVQAARFEISDVEQLRAALEASGDAALRVRVAPGSVQVHGVTFPAEGRVTLSQWWSRESLLLRLGQLPAGVALQAVVADPSAAYLCTVGEAVVREILLQPLPATTLFMKERTSQGDPSVWRNASLLPEERKKRQPPVEPAAGVQVLRDDVPPVAPLASVAPDREAVDAKQTAPDVRGEEEEAPLDEQETAVAPTVSALERLEELPGLHAVKRQVRDLAAFALFERERRAALGLTGEPLTLHMAFLGNPGTGKTMVARMIGRLYWEAGLLSRGHVVEVDRTKLIGPYMGHTEQNLAKAIKQARGGILFIDEAYALHNKDSGKDFGHQVINGLVKAMEDRRGDLVVILAGYRREMQELLAANPGLRERVPFHVEFPDYAEDELLAIADYMAGLDHYQLSPTARDLLLKRVQRERVDETFGNARTVRNVLEKAKIRHAVRAVDEAERGADAYTLLEADDFADEPSEAAETVERVLAELEALVGLAEVKSWVRGVRDLLAMEQQRAVHGLEATAPTLHMAFTGNPGTGKTTVARLIGRLFRAMGLLPRGHFVEVSRKDLVAGYAGQTALKTEERIREALGGVLFVDEAYALAKNSRDAFGAEALATLIKEMEDRRGQLTVILAGYPQEMEALFTLNPGLKSRVRFHLRFPDYAASDLLAIVTHKATAASYRLTPEAEEKLWRYFLQETLATDDSSSSQTFGNGRLAENVFEAAKLHLSTRLARQAEVTAEDLITIREEDVREFDIK